MRAFVTGGTGFVGANLVRLLVDQGWSVRALVRAESSLDNLRQLDVEVVKGNLNDPELAKQMAGCQVMFHVAAHYSLWQSDRVAVYRHNVLGTRNVMAAAHQAGIERTVYTSSVAAIGTGKNGASVDETHQSPVEKLVGHYKQSKFWAEQEAYRAIAQGQDIVIVNPTAPIGAWDVKPTATGDIVLRFLRRQMPFYVDTGLNFVDVQDVALGHLLALEKGKSGDRYILGNQNLSLKAILDILENLTGIAAPKRSLPLWIPLSVAWVDEMLLTKLGKSPSIPLDGVRMSKQPMYYNPTKAIQHLGLPQTPITEALQEAVNWFVSNGYAG
jgi:dihydroflavonol-4-reductase